MSMQKTTTTIPVSMLPPAVGKSSKLTTTTWHKEENFTYCKHRHISRTFLLKISVSNQGCGLSAITSGHHAINLRKLTLFSGNFMV